MLAHRQLSAAELARALGVYGKTVASYLDLPVGLLLVRGLEPWHSNAGKQHVKSPRVHVRDSGIVHALLDNAILDVGPSRCRSKLGRHGDRDCTCGHTGRTQANVYRSGGGIEVDLLLMLPGGDRWAAEVKRSFSGARLPSCLRGTTAATAHGRLSWRRVVPLSDGIEVMPMNEFARGLLAVNSYRHGRRPLTTIDCRRV